jgi:hypothetical protein
MILMGLFLLSASSVLAQLCLHGYCPCKGNFDCDEDIDGTDAAVFKMFYGRGPFNPYCRPNCQAPLSKTGQTTSYATGDDGDLEVGIEWDEPRFYDNGDGTITDALTGLVWLKNANCFGQRTWSEALSDCNGLASSSCGLTDGSSAGDWRLPNAKEFQSLIDFSMVGPALPTGHPFENVQYDYEYWSSTTNASNTDFALGMKMYHGLVEHILKSDSNYYVWPVRNDQ